VDATGIGLAVAPGPTLDGAKWGVERAGEHRLTRRVDAGDLPIGVAEDNNHARRVGQLIEPPVRIVVIADGSADGADDLRLPDHAAMCLVREVGGGRRILDRSEPSFAISALIVGIGVGAATGVAL